ncbi:hypothetical protein CWO23_19145 [Vibrio splendidus]|uniref:hypothetical protein n=1 Tax=Vibrio splendidus TaxID=29497 RepID=UPI000D3B10A1|nr:hypothetical protein [Vibrio splendidus]PTP65327.1 hypothetical protein CWO23_19145 [Vibrio splendidus]
MFETTAEKMTRLLNEEKEYLWAEISKFRKELDATNELVASIEKAAPEHFKELKSSSKEASFYRNRASEQYEAIQEIRKALDKNVEFIQDISNKVEGSHEQVTRAQVSSQETLDKILVASEDFGITSSEASKHIESLALLADKNEVLAEKVQAVEELVEQSNIQNSRLKTLVSSSEKERKLIQDIYHEINGYEINDEDGNSQQVEGLSKKLEDSYQKIKNDLSELTTELDVLKENQNQKLSGFEDEFKNRTEDFLYTANIQRKGIVEKIASLLPSALTAGLSGAYVHKIDVEQQLSEKHERSFFFAILGLIVCSMVPVVFNGYRIVQGEEISSVVKDIPVLLAMMLPVYVPILWVAYTSNKSYKLSKRLIEEYTHKEVLSKTFEGLSKQIENLGEDSSNEELRVKLLYNLLQVNSENPGKLISDYNHSDHPILDAIDKSSKLAEAINKLENVPLISPLLKHINAREQAKVEKSKEDICTALETQINEPEEKKKEVA